MMEEVEEGRSGEELFAEEVEEEDGKVEGGLSLSESTCFVMVEVSSILFERVMLFSNC